MSPSIIHDLSRLLFNAPTLLYTGSLIQKSLHEEPWGEAGHRSMKGRNSLRRLADDGEVQAIDRMLADPEMVRDRQRHYTKNIDKYNQDKRVLGLSA